MYYDGTTPYNRPRAYSIGDIITTNNTTFYVIEESEISQDYVVALKSEPLTVAEVNLYGGVGTENNHVNVQNCLSDESCYRTAVNINGYGGMAYYTGSTCYKFYDDYTNKPYNYTNGCKSDYSSSYIKYVIDNWANDLVDSIYLNNARLINFDDLIDNLGYEYKYNGSGNIFGKTDETPDWLYNSQYVYWINPSNEGYAMNYDGLLLKYSSGDKDYVMNYSLVIRPVINVSKFAISS